MRKKEKREKVLGDIIHTRDKVYGKM